MLYVKKQFERGKSLKVTHITESKTLSQNAYCWLVFTHIGQETGYTKDEVYEFCLRKFRSFKEIEIAGEIEMIPIRLSGMSKDQTSLFIDQLVTFFRCEGYDVPDPEDRKTIDMYNYYKQKGII
jgi:hypothetical protein